MDTPDPQPVFEFNTPDLLEIAELIHDLSPSSSCGVDGITSRLLKATCPTIIKLIHHICTFSINTNFFPTTWKAALITLLYQSGDNSDPSNFCPISVLPCLGKILEHVTHNQLYRYLTEYNILAEEQSGFRKGHSTGTGLMNFLDYIFTN